MSSITILVATPGPSSAVRDTLIDWSAAGMIGPFIYVESDGQSRLDGIQVEEGVPSLIDVGTLAGGHRRPDSIRVCALVPMLEQWGEDPTEHARSIANSLEGAFGDILHVARLRVVAARNGDTTKSDRVALEGWHNVLLSAEDSAGPGMGHTSLSSDQEPGDIAIHTAAGLAGVLGLWSGDDTSALDGLDLLPGTYVRLARSFYRRLESEAVERDLRQGVLSVGRQLPRPHYRGTPTVTIDNSGLAAQEMSARLWSRHRSLVTPAREQRPAQVTKAVSIGEALRMFFSFLWAAIRNAPGAWAADMVARIGASTAGFVTNGVFGRSPSEYKVVSAGMNPDGTPASWREFTRSAAVLEQSLQQIGVPQEHYVREPLSELWKDYSDAARTLADAGERSASMPPIQIGTQYAVMPTAEDIVPGPASSFDGLPAHLADHFMKHQLAPYDILETNTLSDRLQAAATDSTMGASASTALHELQGWKRQHGSSFAVQVAEPIARALHGAMQESRGLLDRLRRLENPDNLKAQAQSNQKRNGHRMLIATLVAVVAIALVSLLFGLEVMTVEWYIGTVSVITIAWFVTAMLLFLRSQQALFQLMHARRDLTEGADIDRRNLMRALRDIRRLSDAYNQFLAWSRVLGVFLADPFGKAPDGGSASNSTLTRLPLSVGLGDTVSDHQTIASVAAEMRRAYFGTGWLEAPWETVLAESKHVLGTRAFEIGADPAALFSEYATDTDSHLLFWVDQLESRGIPEAVGDRAWNDAVAYLENVPDAMNKLLGRVELHSTIGRPVITSEEFFGALVREDGPRRDAMNMDLLIANAKVSDRARVTVNSLRRQDVGFNRAICLTQLSEGFPAYEVDAFAETRTAPWWQAEREHAEEVSTAIESAIAPVHPAEAAPRGPFDEQSF